MQQYGGEAKKLASLKEKGEQARRKYGMNYKQYFQPVLDITRSSAVTKYTCARAYQKESWIISETCIRIRITCSWKTLCFGRYTGYDE